ncbi:penicillin-binding protein activator LpoB, partial [bacterium]
MKKLLVIIPLLFVLYGCPSLVDEIPPDPGT